MTIDNPTTSKTTVSEQSTNGDENTVENVESPKSSKRVSSNAAARRRFSIPIYSKRPTTAFDGISEKSEDGCSTGSGEEKNQPIGKIEEVEEADDRTIKLSKSAVKFSVTRAEPNMSDIEEVHGEKAKSNTHAEHKRRRPRSQSVSINEGKDSATSEHPDGIEIVLAEKAKLERDKATGRKETDGGSSTTEETGILNTGRTKRISTSESENRHNMGVLDRQVSFDESELNNPGSSKETSVVDKMDGNAKSDVAPDKKDIEDYYANNQYTITGMFEKNQDTLRRLPNYYAKQLQMQGKAPSIAGTSMKSTKSTPGALTPTVPTQSRFTKSFYWLAHNHKSYGFRHLFMLIIVFGYTMLGALIFYTVESNHEITTMKERFAALELALDRLSANISRQINDPAINVDARNMKIFLRESYNQLLEIESLYSGSTYYKMADTEHNLKWTFGSAFFFSMNVYTTTGYGAIAPDSILGKTCVIIYGLMFIPLTLVVIRDLGQWALVHITSLYILIQVKLREAMGYVHKEEDHDEVVSLPMKFSLALMLGYQMMTTVFIFEYDRLYGSEHISFFHSFYFSFISLSTVGLGDIMPTYVTFSPIITIIFFLGMPCIKVINRVTYIFVENGVFGILTLIESKMENMCTTKDVTKPDVEATIPAITLTPASVPSTPRSVRSYSIASGTLTAADASDDDEIDPIQYRNNFTIRSVAALMRSNADIYAGGYGRVGLRRGDVVGSRNDNSTDNQSTVRSRSASTAIR